MWRIITVICVLGALAALLPATAAAQAVDLFDGDARDLASPNDLVVYANAEYAPPPPAVTLTDSGGLWRMNEWVALTEPGQWIEAAIDAPDVTTVVVQFWGDESDGWARVLVDGATAKRLNTYGENADWPGGAFVKYLVVDGLAPGPHIVRVENMGRAGPGGGDDVTVMFFGFSPVAQAEPAGETCPFAYCAVFDRVWASEERPLEQIRTQMSGDASRLVFTAWDPQAAAWFVYFVSPDGAEWTTVPVPDLDGRAIDELTVSRDGTRAFFHATDAPAGPRSRIYAATEGGVSLVLDVADWPDVGGAFNLRTTADGAWVYFVENNEDLWRVAADGGAPELVIDDRSVARDGGEGAGIRIFDLSADGAAIAFVLYGYFPPEGGDAALKNEAFLWQGGGVTQLSNDEGNRYKEKIAVSGDGSTVAYWSGTDLYATTGGAPLLLVEGTGSNTLRLDFPQRGDWVLAAGDFSAGRLIRTDGSAQLELLPGWSVNNIALSIVDNATISDDGTRVSFQTPYGSFPFVAAHWVGYLNDLEAARAAVPDAPYISGIAFDPPFIARGDPEAATALTAGTDDADGPADVVHGSTDVMLNGLHLTYWDLPLYLSAGLNDAGVWPDAAAGDGIWSTQAQTGPAADNTEVATMRVALGDRAGTVVVADALLGLGAQAPAPAGPIGPQPPAPAGAEPASAPAAEPVTEPATEPATEPGTAPTEVGPAAPGGTPAQPPAGGAPEGDTGAQQCGPVLVYQVEAEVIPAMLEVIARLGVEGWEPVDEAAFVGDERALLVFVRDGEERVVLITADPAGGLTTVVVVGE